MIEGSQGTAEAITETLVGYLSSSGLVLEHLAGGSSDGAAVMMGVLEGLMTSLTEIVPCFVSAHCAAHCLALAALHAGGYMMRLEDTPSENEIRAEFNPSHFHTVACQYLDGLIANSEDCFP